jgi:uncharacterized protein
MTSRGSGRWAWRGALAVLLAVGLACSGVPDGGGQPENQPPPAAPGTGGASGPDTFNDDARAAIETAQQYWQDVFRQSGRRFEPISRIVPYTRDGEVSCGGQAMTRNNAAYCSAGDFIAYDSRWAQSAWRKIGDAFIYYMLDHEYAHGIQVRFGLQYRFTIEQELQADCMAGATLGDSIRANRLSLEDGDIQELQDGLAAVADDPGQPWFAEGAHGSAEQRTDAFFAGYRRSVAACNLD